MPPALPDRVAWGAAVGCALVGEPLTLPPGDGPPSVADVLAALAAAGWTAERLADLRDRRRADGQPWPLPLPLELPAQRAMAADAPGPAPAQLHALVTEVRRAVHLSGVVSAGPRRATGALTADEVRLLRDVPPHHGS